MLSFNILWALGRLSLTYIADAWLMCNSDVLGCIDHLPSQISHAACLRHSGPLLPEAVEQSFTVHCKHISRHPPSLTFGRVLRHCGDILQKAKFLLLNWWISSGCRAMWRFHNDWLPSCCLSHLDGLWAGSYITAV